MLAPRRFSPLLVLAPWLLAATGAVAGPRVLFDASHRENAANADWVIDADAVDLLQAHYPCGPSDFEPEARAQRHPTPPAETITARTPETYRTGAASAFAIDLVKLGYDVALGAAECEVRRSTSPDFLATHPPPDETHLLDRVTATAFEDGATPGPGEAFHYDVRAAE